MSGTTKIEWADRVWNPVTGCVKVSEGCRNCYAKELHDRRHKAYQQGKKLPGQYAHPFEEVICHWERRYDPMRWKKPARVFVNSMSDLFHSAVSWQFLAEIFAVMAACPEHTFLVLTKRADKLSILGDADFIADVDYEFHGLADTAPAKEKRRWIANQQYWGPRQRWPLPNVWLGVSVENQGAAEARIPHLLQTPAAVRFVSCEPLLGPVDLTHYLQFPPFTEGYKMTWGLNEFEGLNWVIVGGESGPGARAMHPDWARSLRDQCQAAGAAFFFKQWGEWRLVRDSGEAPMPQGERLWERIGKKAAGRLLDGQEWSEFPKARGEG